MIDLGLILAHLGVLYGWMPQDILRRLTWRQIVVLYRRGWDAEEVRGSSREVGRVHFYAKREDPAPRVEEASSRPVDDGPDVEAIEQRYGSMIKRTTANDR